MNTYVLKILRQAQHEIRCGFHPDFVYFQPTNTKMCDFAKGFKLCTCAALEAKLQQPPSNIKPRRKRSKAASEQGLYYWTLERVISENEIIAIGRYIFPAESLEHGLDAEWVELNLNVGECFDFAYSPQENDWLQIYPAEKNHRLKYLSFIYRKGAWIQDFHDGISKSFHLHHAGTVHEILS
jgi:hypothetical protein